MLKEWFEDADWGVVVVVRNKRAKRVIARRRNDAIQLTAPEFYSLPQIRNLFDALKPRLNKLRAVEKIFFDESANLTTLTFRLEIKKSAVNNIYINLIDGVLRLVFPLSADFHNDEIQRLIKGYVEAALRLEAKRIIPAKVGMLAQKFGFAYSGVKIQKSRTRWGSCSSRKSINISMYCLFLPEYLLDFIILHELCHTIEMNHGKRFWALLDSVSGNKAQQFTKELKNVKIPL